jgi:hypothetical protein
LLNGGWAKPEDAQFLVQALIAETGGLPEMLCLKLADRSTWIV